MAEHAPIIIKKIKKGGHGGHHGGAWKVAYADFVTAMMAFFLLMWLLNASSQEQRRGISNYFGPSGNMIGAGGSGGILGGLAIESEGNFETAKDVSSPSPESSKLELADGQEEAPASTSSVGNGEALGGEKISSPKEKKQSEEEKAKAEASKVIRQKEDQMFKEAENMIRQAIQETPDLKELAQNLIIENTPEGLRIQIVDKERYSMFPNGKAEMFDHTKKLLQKVSKVIEKLPNKVSIAGHTDAKPFSPNSSYSNWELSTDRANATRRELLKDGFPGERILNIVGKADQEPLKPSQPEDDQNRRISITLLRTH